MTHNEITNGLNQLGFNSGYVVTGDQITLWENDQEQPSLDEIANAAKLWQNTLQAEVEAKSRSRQAVLAKLGLTADEVAALLG